MSQSAAAVCSHACESNLSVRTGWHTSGLRLTGKHSGGGKQIQAEINSNGSREETSDLLSVVGEDKLNETRLVSDDTN